MIENLEKMRAGNLHFLSDHREVGRFLHFLAVQSLRSPGVARRVTQGFGNDRTLGVLRHIAGTAIGWSLYASRASLRISLLDASPSVKFITGDQCVINTKARPGEPPSSDAFELYYPLSPHLAILVTADDGEPGQHRVQLDRPAMERYNRLIADFSDEQIYAHEERSLVEAWGDEC